MKRFFVVATVLTVLSVAAVPANADVTIWMGQADSDDLVIESSSIIGGALGFTFAGFFGAELVVDYMRDGNLPFDLDELEQQLGIDVSMDYIFISGNLVLQYPLAGFTPYATAGFGVFGTRLSSELNVEDEMSGSTAFNYGGGVKVDIGPMFALRGDFRMYHLNMEDDNLFGNPLNTAENPTFTRFAFGLSFVF